MANYYLSTPLMWNHPIEEIFQTAHQHNLGLELFHQQMEYHGVTVERVQQLIEKYHQEVFVHAFSWDLNLSSLQEPVREVAIQQTIQSINFAKQIGAKDVTIHPGRMSIALDPSAYDSWMRESMETLLDHAAGIGQPISFEIMEPIGKEFITDRHVLERVAGDLWEQVYVTLDLAHCQDEQMIRDHLTNLPRIRKLHISNHQNGVYHTPLGEGELDFAALKPLLLEKNLPMVIEGMDLSNKQTVLQKNIKFLEELYK